MITTIRNLFARDTGSRDLPAAVVGLTAGEAIDAGIAARRAARLRNEAQSRRARQTGARNRAARVLGRGIA